jgi:hypothetical protein
MSISQNFPAISPTLNLNFARSKKLDPRITFTRTSSATRTNAQGLIEVVSTDTPRFDHSYNSSTGSVNSLGLLIEESRSNLITYSEQFDNAAWSKVRTSASANVAETTAPNGTNSAEKLVEDTSPSTDHFINLDASGSTSATYTASIFIKSAERYRIRFQIIATGAAGNRASAWFDSNTGSVVSTLAEGNGSVITTSIQQYPNGWYRCILTGIPSTVGSGTAVNFNVTLNTTSTNTVYTGDGTSGIYIWGAQLEAGAFPTSYIPTVASTVTRSADNASMTGTNFTSWYNSTEGSVFSEIGSYSNAGASINAGFFQIDGGSSANTIRSFGGSTVSPVFDVTSSSTNQVYIFAGTLIPSSISKLICAYKANDFARAVNGSNLDTDTSGTVPTVNQMLLGNGSGGVSPLNGTIRRISYYPRRLTNTQLQNLTK